MALPPPPTTHISISCATILPWHTPLIATQLTTLTISAPALLSPRQTATVLSGSSWAAGLLLLHPVSDPGRSQLPDGQSSSAGTWLLLTKLLIICGPPDSGCHCQVFSWTSKVLHSQPSHPLSRIILTCPYGCPSPSWGHGLFPRPHFFLSVSPTSSLSRSLHIYSPTNPSGLARCLSSPSLLLSLRQKRSVACHPFQFLPATSTLGHPSDQTVRLGAFVRSSLYP